MHYYWDSISEKKVIWMDDETKELVERLFEIGKQYEIVGTTVGKKGKGKANAAALGIVWDGLAFTMKVFKGSDTFRNLRGLRRIGVNVVTLDDVHLIARSALIGWNTDEQEFVREDYVYTRGFPFLKDAAIHIDCSVDDWIENYGTDELGSYHISNLRAVPERSRVNREGASPIRRDDSPIMEAMIFVTRWHVTEGKTKVFLREKVEAHLKEASIGANDSTRKAIKVVEDFLEYNE